MSVPVLQDGPYVFNSETGYETDTSIKRKKVLLAIKNLIVGLGGAGAIWEVVASSDSSAVKNIGDADPDLWLTYANVINGTGAHSWVVVENQTTGYQLCIDYRYSYLYPNNVFVYCSLGGTYSTDGTTSARPSCSDEGTLWSNAFDMQFNTYDNYAVYAMTSASHKTLRVFHVGKHDTTSGEYFSKGILIEEVENTPSGWISETKYAVLSEPAINASTSASQQSPRFQDISHKFWIRLKTAEPYEGWLRCYEAVECYDLISSNQGKPLCIDANEHDSLGGYPICEIGLLSLDVDRGGSYGRLKDIFFGPNNDAMYTTYPGDSSRQWIKLGCFIVPWDGSDPASGLAHDIGISDNFLDSSGEGELVRVNPRLVRTSE